MTSTPHTPATAQQHRISPSMTDLFSDAGQPNPVPEPDPLAPLIDQARTQGWAIIPSVGFGVVDHMLIRRRDQLTTDIVTIPPSGDSTVVRLHGAINPVQPRRSGTQWWRHHVPVRVALDWLLSNSDDDHTLNDWLRSHAPRDGDATGTG